MNVSSTSLTMLAELHRAITRYYKNKARRCANKIPTSRFIRPPSPVPTAFANLFFEVMCFQRRKVLQPVALLRCYTKVPISRVYSGVMQGEPTRLRRLDLLDLLLLGPTPPLVVYWRCRLDFFSSSSYLTLLLGLGGPGGLSSRFGEKSDRTGERSSGPRRPAQNTIGRSRAARHKEDIKKKVVAATRAMNTGNLDTNPLNGLNRKHIRTRLRLCEGRPYSPMSQGSLESGRIHTQFSSLSTSDPLPPVPPPKVDLR